VATLGIQSKKGWWIDVDVIADTGADFTYLPQRLSKELGISLKEDCRPIKSHGVGGAAKGYFCERPLICRIGAIEFQMSVVFSSANHVPPLLGRFQGMDRFKVCFDGKRTTFQKTG